MLRKLLKRLFNTAAKRYTTTGVGFGLMFPIIATTIAIAVGQLPLTLNSAASVQGSNQLLWIIDTAPLFLGLLAYFAGQRSALTVPGLPGQARRWCLCFPACAAPIPVVAKSPSAKTAATPSPGALPSRRGSARPAWR